MTFPPRRFDSHLKNSTTAPFFFILSMEVAEAESKTRSLRGQLVPSPCTPTSIATSIPRNLPSLPCTLAPPTPSPSTSVIMPSVPNPTPSFTITLEAVVALDAELSSLAIRSSPAVWIMLPPYRTCRHRPTLTDVCDHCCARAEKVAPNGGCDDVCDLGGVGAAVVAPVGGGIDVRDPISIDHRRIRNLRNAVGVWAEGWGWSSGGGIGRWRR